MALQYSKTTISILAALLMVGATTSPASAKDDARQFSAASGGVINTTMLLADEGNYEAALNNLRDFISKPGLKAYERATIYQMMGQYSYELGRPSESRLAFQNAISSGGLLPDEVKNLEIVIAQLLIGSGQYWEGADRLEKVINEDGFPGTKYLELLVNAWVQSEDYPRALPWTEEWFETAVPKERKHYDLLNFLYHQLDMKNDQIETLKKMIDRWPEDKNLWDSWASILANTDREAEAFEVHKMMYQAGLITREDELLKLIQYYAYYDLPFQAAEILEKEIGEGRIAATSENLKRAASLFRQARAPERSLPYFEKAAKISADPDLIVKLGQAFADAAKCGKAEAAITTAAQQGYDQGKAWMLVGMCYFDKYGKIDRLSCDMTAAQRRQAPLSIARSAALKAFNTVPQTSNDSKNAAKWVQFIEDEIQADERRCQGRGTDVKVELCYMKIKQAYDAAVFTNGFKLDDASCEEYITEYDTKYRTGQPSK